METIECIKSVVEGFQDYLYQNNFSDKKTPSKLRFIKGIRPTIIKAYKQYYIEIYNDEELLYKVEYQSIDSEDIVNPILIRLLISTILNNSKNKKYE